MANPELAQVEVVKKTLRVVDPFREAIVIGTGGIALHFADRGHGMPTKVEDVDLIAPAESVWRLHDLHSRSPYVVAGEMNSPSRGYQVPDGEAKFEITPVNGFDILPTTVVSGIEDSFYQMPADVARAESVEASGEATLPLDVLLTWKILAGRPKDLNAGEVLVRYVDMHGLVAPAAVRSLRGILELNRLVLQRK